MRVRALAAVVSEKQKKKKSDAASAAADPTPLKNGGRKADKERSLFAPEERTALKLSHIGSSYGRCNCCCCSDDSWCTFYFCVS
jgi:hypothetical protein